MGAWAGVEFLEELLEIVAQPVPAVPLSPPQHQAVLRVRQLFIVKALSSTSLNSKNCTHMNIQLQCKGE